jgi:hypothetical protein
MAETKRSGLPIVAGPSTSVTQEVAHVDKKGCLNLLPRWTSHFQWFPSALTEDFETLMILLDPGRVSIRDLSVNGPLIQQRFNELATETDAETLEALRLIQDRYGRLRIPISRRPSLGDPVLAHLGIERGHKSTIYVAIFPNSIDLLSPAYRNARLTIIKEEIDDLPFMDS